MKTILIFIITLFWLFSSLKVSSQPEQPENLRKDAVKLFIDCIYCDMDHIRREIPYVNYVRDVKEAQLYIRETRQSTGSGGSEFSYIFTGQKEFFGLNDTLVYCTRPDDTRDIIRQGRTDMMKMGLMRYVARTPIYKEVSIKHIGKEEEEEVSDKWNNWVFEVETNTWINLEESNKMYSFWNSFSVNRITPEWKIEMDFDHNLRRRKYTFEDEEQIKDRTSADFTCLIVKSLGEHWSAGAWNHLTSSTFRNLKFQANIFPAVEYNFFPYSESTHHQLRFLYGIGVSLNQYNDTTIYGKIKENLLKQEINVAYQVKEKWGSVNISLEGSNYLHDFSKNRLNLNGNIRLRIVKGLSLNIWGGVARIRDQLSLAGEELTEADILLHLQEQATSYSFYTSFGLSYTFGSIYNNVVNPRFGN